MADGRMQDMGRGSSMRAGAYWGAGDGEMVSEDDGRHGKTGRATVSWSEGSCHGGDYGNWVG